MKDEFFQSLVNALQAENSKHRTADVPQEILEAFFSNAPKAPAPVAETASVCEIPEPPETPAPPPPQTVSAPTGTLAEIAAAVAGCTRCRLCEKRTNPVPGEGNPNADLMFIGEGPGAEEDATGRPFVGAAGQLLDKMINAMTFQREDVFIANIVKCRPPGNRAPAPDEAAACIGYLKGQIAQVRPKVIVCLGATALTFLTGEQGGITRLRGKWLEFEGIPVMPTFHPAYLLRQPSAKRDAWHDLQMVMKVLGKSR